MWDIAARYHELVDPLNSGEGVRGTGELVPLMPATYTESVREFERLYDLMRNRAKQESFRGVSVGTLRWHILEYHLKAEKVVRIEPVRVLKGRKRVQLRDANGDLVVRLNVGYRRHPDAREGRAVDGIEWIAGRWGLRSEPMLPRELLVAA